MTTINDISDLARILREQPEWATTLRSLLLTEELLNLPNRFAELAQQVSELSQQFSEFILETRENNRLANERLTRLEKLAQEQGEQLREQSGQLRLMQETLAQLTERTDHLEGRVSNLEGGQYERRVRNRALFRARRWHSLEEPYLAMVQDWQSAPEFNRAITLALNNQVITDDDGEDLHNADLIISGRNSRHMVIEVSITAAEDDIVRARRRAEILAAATGDIVEPAIASSQVSERERGRAADAGVTVMIFSQQ